MPINYIILANFYRILPDFGPKTPLFWRFCPTFGFRQVGRYVWTPLLGERLQIEIEEDNTKAVAVQKCGVVVGHLPSGGS